MRAARYFPLARLLLGGGVSEAELTLMRLIDEGHLKYPFYGSRRIRDWLEDQGHRVNRKKVRSG